MPRLAGSHAVLEIADHAASRKTHTPAIEQEAEIRGATGLHHGHRIIGITAIRLGKRIEKNNQASSAKHELVELVHHRIRQILRMNHQ